MQRGSSRSNFLLKKPSCIAVSIPKVSQFEDLHHRQCHTQASRGMHETFRLCRCRYSLDKTGHVHFIEVLKFINRSTSILSIILIINVKAKLPKCQFCIISIKASTATAEHYFKVFLLNKSKLSQIIPVLTK